MSLYSGLIFYFLDSSEYIWYNSTMQKMEDLIRENSELRSRLDLAEKWIRKEIQWSISKIQREQSKKWTRKAIGNIFETEWLDILTRRILGQFDNSLENAPKYIGIPSNDILRWMLSLLFSRIRRYSMLGSRKSWSHHGEFIRLIEWVILLTEDPRNIVQMLLKLILPIFVPGNIHSRLVDSIR